MRNKRTCSGCIIFPLLYLIYASASFADDSLTASGRLNLRGVEALHSDSVKEDPSLTGRIKLDSDGSSWKFHAWVEGGYDGTVRKPIRDHSLFKSYDEVYQDNTSFFEVKEFHLSHTSHDLELRAGIQRFAWGRLDEYPPNDLLNPWDYTQFLRKPLEDRKIGVPSISATLNKGDWAYDTVWVPWFVPYRLPMPNERWSGISSASALSQVPDAVIVPREPDLPPHTIENGSLGWRARHSGDIEWALNFFHGYDTRPVFKAASLVIQPQPGMILIDPGYSPNFHRIGVIGLDGAAVRGDWSLRFETAYTRDRYFNIRRELWGYPAVPSPGIHPLNPIEEKSDALDYGLGADYRLFEDGLLTMQAQQTVLLDRTDAFYERKVETILWMNIKADWMNQKVETNASIAYNPEHGDTLSKVNAWYVFTDSWKAGITSIDLNGPQQSIFGRYARNDQVEAELVYSW